MDVFYTKIETDGKIQLPPQVLESLDFQIGQDLALELEKNALRVSLTRAEKLRKAQALVREYVSPEISLADELIEDRRREAEND